jgi:hypothetical protein
MATSTYLSNPGVEVNSVSLTDQCYQLHRHTARLNRLSQLVSV